MRLYIIHFLGFYMILNMFGNNFEIFFKFGNFRFSQRINFHEDFSQMYFEELVVVIWDFKFLLELS